MMSSKENPRTLVIDASIALSWCFADEADPYADTIARALPDLHLVVPTLWHVEIANALLMAERRKRSSAADTARWIDYLRSLPLEIDEATASYAWSDTFTLARLHGLTAYDAAYLEVSLRRGIPLATLDRSMAKAARAAKVRLHAA